MKTKTRSRSKQTKRPSSDGIIKRSGAKTKVAGAAAGAVMGGLVAGPVGAVLGGVVGTVMAAGGSRIRRAFKKAPSSAAVKKGAKPATGKTTAKGTRTKSAGRKTAARPKATATKATASRKKKS